MHMWMWFGYNVGDFLFSGLEITTRWAFALTWIALFVIALLFEASKVYLARVQRAAQKKLYPYRSDERRNLLCDSASLQGLKSQMYEAGDVGVVLGGRRLARSSSGAVSTCSDPRTEARRNHLIYVFTTNNLSRLYSGAFCGSHAASATREQGATDPSTSRNASTATVDRWASLRIRLLVNLHQTVIFLMHNVVGYLLMLAVMIYNVHLLLAVVFGMMLGYFLFGTKLTRLQMQCFGIKRTVVCTPECDDTAAESTAPHLLDSSLSTESDFFICQTRTCIQPSHYFPANSQEGTSSQTAHATCHYGAKKCPSKVARAKRNLQNIKSSHCHHGESEKEDSPSVEDVQLLRTERQGCCKKKQEPPPIEEKKCKTSSLPETSVVEEKKSCCKKEDSLEQGKELQERENSPQIRCCHSSKSVLAESQEQIIK